MTPQDPSRDDARLADLLATLGTTAAPPDEVLLARLRAETGAVFATTPAQPPHEETHPQAPGVWRRKMFRYGMLAAAAVILLGLSFLSWLQPVSGPSLAEVLAKIEELDSFEAELRV